MNKPNATSFPLTYTRSANGPEEIQTTRKISNIDAPMASRNGFTETTNTETMTTTAQALANLADVIAEETNDADAERVALETLKALLP